MKNNELILILDFGGQYNQLIARRVRECNVYSEVVPFDISIDKIKKKIQRELSLQVDLQAFMVKIHQNVIKKFLNSEFLYLVYVMACNL